MTRPDPHSFRDDTQPVVEHLSWDVRAGYLFLRAIAESVGAERFLGFLSDFLTAFRFCSVTGEEVVAFARERLPGAVDYDEWLYGTRLPAGAPAGLLAELDSRYHLTASANPDTCLLAQECFERNRGRYHPIAVTVVGTRLSQAARGIAPRTTSNH